MNKSMGALWQKKNEKGEFYTGVLENKDGTKTKIVIFKNGYKDKDTKPDYLIYQAREKQESFGISDNDPDLPF